MSIVIAALCVAVTILFCFGTYESFQNSGLSFSYNVTSERMFGNLTHPEDDDISYMEAKMLTDSSGIKSYFVVTNVTN